MTRANNLSPEGKFKVSMGFIERPYLEEKKRKTIWKVFISLPFSNKQSFY